MKFIIKLVACFVLVCTVIGIVDLWNDKTTLQDTLIRLHIVGNSDSEADQQVKLKVKDAVVDYLKPIMEKMPTKDEAIDYIRDNLPALEAFSNNILDALGVKERAKVSIQPQSFDTRDYDTFSLPSGVYDALRIEIGAAEGKNWWCVAFPALCVPATSDGFADTAVSAGFSQTLVRTLSGGNAYRLRFFFLDCMGKLENLFF